VRSVGPERVTVSRRPLHERERSTLLPDLEERGFSPSMLDIIPPAGRHFQLLRAIGPDGGLLGATSLMSVRPFVSIKQLLGEGNHVGWDSSIYYSQNADRTAVTVALLRAMARRSFYYAMYFGRIDEDIRAALPFVRHRLFESEYRLGRIDCSQFDDAGDFLAGHKRLRRHLRDHAGAGGEVHVAEGPVPGALADAFSRLVLTTYRHHGGIGRWQFREYAFGACHAFFANCIDAVHIYTTNAGKVTGLQSFIRHPDRLELSEGGFDRSVTRHDYEVIIAESVAYAVRNGLDSVGYGGIWNAGKDRYTDRAGREPIHLLQVYANRWQYRLAGDRLSAWAFGRYFGGRFGGATGTVRLISRQG
jgi:hypothetical protein